MPMITLADVRDAAARIQGRVIRTPALASDAISRATGAQVVLKLDNLQATGAFKERGAANRLALLSEAERRAGVIAMSAGNHAQAVARHASLLGIAAVIVMPKHTPATKVTRTAAWGARVVLHGETLAEAAEHAHVLSAAEGLVFVHPYDDAAVMAGQGTLALELLEDAPDLDMLVIPVGGGGLLAGCAVAAAGLKPGIVVIGVEVAAYAALAQRLAGQPVSVGGATIAEGIAVRDIGEIALRHIRAHVADVVVVPERAVEEAIALLAEGAKVVAGAPGPRAWLRCSPCRTGLPARRSESPSAAATSIRASWRTYCCATCCAMGGWCDWCWKFPTAPACWPILPGGLARPGATSSTCRTTDCSPRPACRRRSWK